jgi:hypothetical protein
MQLSKPDQKESKRNLVNKLAHSTRKTDNKVGLFKRIGEKFGKLLAKHNRVCKSGGLAK